MEKLKRKHFKVEGTEYEIDLYGEGQRNGNKVIVIGEVKHRIYAREVRSFNKILARITPLINKDKDVVKVMFGFLVHKIYGSLWEQNRGLKRPWSIPC